MGWGRARFFDKPVAPRPYVRRGQFLPKSRTFVDRKISQFDRVSRSQMEQAPMIAFTCPACAHSGNVPDEYAGKSVTCPKCKMSNRVFREPKPITQLPPRTHQERSLVRFIAKTFAMIVFGTIVCLGMLFLLVNLTSTKRGTAIDASGSASSRKWTKDHTPEWALNLSETKRNAFGRMMIDPSPLYTAFYCDPDTTIVYVNRKEWRALTRFQANNNLMFGVLLPHNDQTEIRYIDDETGDVLATFTAKQPGNTIT